MISIDLSDRTILITGALGAIAEHMVRRLTETGATLVLTDIKSEQKAEQTLHAWHIPSSSYLYFAADITDSRRVEGVVNAAFEKFPRMDTVIGHAGGCGLHPFATTSEADANWVEQSLNRIFPDRSVEDVSHPPDVFIAALTQCGLQVTVEDFRDAVCRIQEGKPHITQWTFGK